MAGRERIAVGSVWSGRVYNEFKSLGQGGSAYQSRTGLEKKFTASEPGGVWHRKGQRGTHCERKETQVFVGSNAAAFGTDALHGLTHSGIKAVVGEYFNCGASSEEGCRGNEALERNAV